MKKRKILIVLAVIVALAVPLTVFAATSDTQPAKAVRSFFGLDASKLTDQQKADIKDFKQKLAVLEKDFIDKMVGNGALTKDQGDAQTKRIDDALANGDESGLLPGFGKSPGGFYGHMKPDSMGGIDTSKLTDDQKTELKGYYKAMAGLQKELVTGMVNDGLLTKDQGDNASKKIDVIFNGLEAKDVSSGIKMLIGGFNFFGMQGIDTSKLTEQQKADLTKSSQKVADLQKQIADKLASYGTITAVQAESIKSRIDSTEKNLEQNGFTKGMGGRMKGMDGRKGQFGSRGKWMNPNGQQSDPSTQQTNPDVSGSQASPTL